MGGRGGNLRYNCMSDNYKAKEHAQLEKKIGISLTSTSMLPGDKIFLWAPERYINRSSDAVVFVPKGILL